MKSSPKFLDNFLKKYVFIPYSKDEIHTEFWKDRISRVILFVINIVLTAVVIPSVIGAAYFEYWGIVVLDSAAYLFFLYLFLNTKLTYNFRIYSISITTFIVGTVVLFALGADGAGFLWMFCLPILTALFLNKNWLIIAFIANFLVVLVYGLLLYFGAMDNWNVPKYEFIPFVLTSSNFFALNVLTAWPVYFLVNRLEKAMVKASKLSELNQLQSKKLKEANEALDRYVYGLSHDIKGPISNVIGLTELYRETDDLVEKEQLFFLVKKSATKLENLLHSIVDFYQGQKLVQQIELIELNSFLEEIIELIDVKFSYPNSKVSFINTAAIFLESDRHKLKTIFLNLISNALKYSTEEENPLVEITYSKNANTHIITISDNGPGIEEKDQERVFELFNKIAQTKTGTGIGLYITKLAVLDLGGEINVKRVSEKGIAFEVQLPVKSIDNTDEDLIAEDDFYFNS